MKTLSDINRPTRGVGDFDTSDLPGGSHPVNGAYYRDPPIKLFQGASARTSRITGEHVETLRSYVRNGYEVTINRYGGDNSRVQVFIDHIQNDTSIVDYVSMNDLDDFIERNTK